jgi:hypothetical protein
VYGQFEDGFYNASGCIYCTFMLVRFQNKIGCEIFNDTYVF